MKEGAGLSLIEPPDLDPPVALGFLVLLPCGVSQPASCGAGKASGTKPAAVFGMRSSILVGVAALATAGLARAQVERLATLKVGSEVYTNVTVTSATVTHLYFSHSRGMGSAKLAELEPDMQRHFHFDSAKAAAQQAEQARNNAQYSEAARRASPPNKPVSAARPELTPTAKGIPPHPVHAKSIVNQPAPELAIEKWLTEAPDTQGKFVLVDFWATWCPPCRRAIPYLNELQAKYKDLLVVIGLSSEPEQVIRKMTEPRIDYAIASDTQRRTSKALEVTGIPHALLIDPKGIVRFEGMPHYLTDDGLQGLLDRYGR